jgi:ADP-heptose:LPS heptosyltransferase
MQTPAHSARVIIDWVGRRPLSVVAAELAALPDGHVLLQAADLIADAADSDDEALRGAGIGALFGGLVEPLNDGFTPAGRAAYARFFGRIVWRVVTRTPSLLAALAGAGIVSEAALLTRHAQVRSVERRAPATARRIVVLSRVTIGADILLASVVLQRLHQRYPQAELVLLGDGKLQGLFAGLPNVRVRPISYARRGPLRERLASWMTVVAAVAQERADLVVAPDSRLDQLGLLPVCDTAQYLLWENLQPEGAAPASLALLLDQWLTRTLDLPTTPTTAPRVALDVNASAVQQRLRDAFGAAPIAAVKLDHGGNPAKALPKAAEIALLRHLRKQGWRVLLDRGFGADELANSDALLTELGWQARDIDDSGKGLGIAINELAPGALADAALIRFHGSIAGWAAALACCGHALSYDSVGHHLAGALGIPVTVAFTGHVDPAFPIAWQPRGRAAVRVVEIATADKNSPHAWQAVLDAVPAPPTQPN